MELIRISTINGNVVTGYKFDYKDYIDLVNIFKDMIEMNKRLQELGGRALNVPDVVSEGIFCYHYNAIRTNASGGSQDAVLLDTGEEVQIKSTSIKRDLTSFGPTSTWDKLYLMDFAPDGYVNGKIKIYLITSNIYEEVLNKSKNETFWMQQEQGRRPRLSLKEIIFRDNIPVDMVIDLRDE